MEHSQKPRLKVPPALQISRPIVLLGMMGAGKSSLGTRLAKRLNVPFSDADTEIEKAAQMSITDIFETHGEAGFRDGERRVIKRLLQAPPQVLALGGGAFMNKETRALIGEKALSIWLDVPVDELVKRVSKHPDKRPLLANKDIEETVVDLLKKRAPIYAKADLRVSLRNLNHNEAVAKILAMLDKSDYIA